MEKSAKGTTQGGLLYISVFEHYSSGFSTKLHQYWLEIFTSCCCYDASHSPTSRKVDFLDLRMRDNGSRDLGCIFRRDEQEVQTTTRETSPIENIDQSMETFGRELRAFQDNCIAGRERVRERATSEDVGCIPGIKSAVNTSW